MDWVFFLILRVVLSGWGLAGLGLILFIGLVYVVVRDRRNNGRRD